MKKATFGPFPMMLRCLLMLVSAFLLCSCGSPVEDTQIELENAAGEALVRQMITDCPHGKEAEALCIVLGDAQLDTSEGFRSRFADLAPKKLLAHRDVTVIRLDEKTRVVEKRGRSEDRKLVLLLQILELKQQRDSYQAIGAWAYKDALQKQEFTLTKQADGKYQVTPGTVLASKVQQP